MLRSPISFGAFKEMNMLVEKLQNGAWPLPANRAEGMLIGSGYSKKSCVMRRRRALKMSDLADNAEKQLGVYFRAKNSMKNQPIKTVFFEPSFLEFEVCRTQLYF